MIKVSKFQEIHTTNQKKIAYAREYNLDKEQTSYNDSLDALRLSLKVIK